MSLCLPLCTRGETGDVWRAHLVFNIAGNRYRLLTAIHYNMRKVFVLRFLTHAEYTRETWKDAL